jgi:hypothetical protein
VRADTVVGDRVAFGSVLFRESSQEGSPMAEKYVTLHKVNARLGVNVFADTTISVNPVHGCDARQMRASKESASACVGKAVSSRS